MAQAEGREEVRGDILASKKQLREIGMRLVETCGTCRHLIKDEKSTSGVKCVKHVAATNMVLVCNDYRGDGAARLLFNRARVPVVATPERRWTSCAHCSWEGWDVDLVTHMLSAGGEDTFSQHCPECEAEVKP